MKVRLQTASNQQGAQFTQKA